MSNWNQRANEIFLEAAEIPDLEARERYVTETCGSDQSLRREVDELIDELAEHEPQAAELVKLRCFAGFGHVEAAEALGIERRTADRLWLLARSWLYRRLSET